MLGCPCVYPSCPFCGHEAVERAKANYRKEALMPQLETWHPCEVCSHKKAHPLDDCVQCGWTAQDLTFVDTQVKVPPPKKPS